MAVGQLSIEWLTNRYRGQAPSHVGFPWLEKMLIKIYCALNVSAIH